MYTNKLRKREQTFIRSSQEPVKKKAQIGKYFYLAILVVIFISLGKFVVEKIVFNKGVGFLEAETIYIEANASGRILNINYAINDTVNLEEPVVVLDKSWAVDSPNGYTASNNSYYTNERRLINTEKEISILRANLAANNEKLRQVKNEYLKAKGLFFANAMIQSELFAVESRLKNAEANILKQKIELAAARKKLTSYKNQQNNLYNPAASNGSSVLGNTLLYSTHVGIVSRIFKNSGEVVKLGEPIVKLINPANQVIRTYFLAGAENEIAKGDNARLYFANGDRADGVISKIYSSTAEQPREIKHKFGKAQRFIIAEIIPNASLNRRVFETQVEVYITKKWFKSISSFF